MAGSRKSLRAKTPAAVYPPIDSTTIADYRGDSAGALLSFGVSG